MHLIQQNMPEAPEGFKPPIKDLPKILKERTINDADLLKNGAEYVLEDGAAEARLELTRNQIAAIELEMRGDFEKTKDFKEEKKKALDVIFAMLDADQSLRHLKDAYRVSTTLPHYFNDPEDEKKYNFEDRLRTMEMYEIKKFLEALQTEQCYITSHEFRSPTKVGEAIRLWLKPPIRKDYPDWGTNPGGGLAEAHVKAYADDFNDPVRQSVGQVGQKLVNEVTKGENATYDLIEEVVIEDNQKRINPFNGPAKYTRWLLRKKAK